MNSDKLVFEIDMTPIEFTKQMLNRRVGLQENDVVLLLIDFYAHAQSERYIDYLDKNSKYKTPFMNKIVELIQELEYHVPQLERTDECVNIMRRCFHKVLTKSGGVLEEEEHRYVNSSQ